MIQKDERNDGERSTSPPSGSNDQSHRILWPELRHASRVIKLKTDDENDEFKNAD